MLLAPAQVRTLTWENAFKPETEQWGQRGLLHCARILDQCRAPVPAEVEMQAKAEEAERKPGHTTLQAHGSASKPISTVMPSSDPLGVDDDGDDAVKASSEVGSVLSDVPDVHSEAEDEGPSAKKVKKEMTVEEYEAMLDAENGEGGFLEAGDIAGYT